MMKNEKEVLVVIPARGGSKGIPRKNIRLLAGFPLIAYSIEIARQAALVTRIIVSTDDEEIAAVARGLGAEVPFLRPPELAQDDTRDLPVFQHALNWLNAKEGYIPELVVQLRPTTPIRERNSLDRAIKLMFDHPAADSVRAVVIPDKNPFKMWTISPDGMLKPLIQLDEIPEAYNAPRQSLPEAYWHSGQIDVIRPETLLVKNSMSGDNIVPITLDPLYAVDIDTMDTWQYAEWVIRSHKLDLAYPGKPPRSWPEKISLAVFDFDGVFTDNRVWVDEQGHEMVAAYRSDSFGISRLASWGIPTLVISTEPNPVVEARCKKMKVEYVHGVQDKVPVLSEILRQKGIPPNETIFTGNDINDLGCFKLAGFAVAVADALPEALNNADLILQHRGGHGAVRELCELILNKYDKKSQ
jgi:YrbI family 3-deoxy-D-manno-octulosonate 8-phosphate phosphatase